MPFPLKLCTLRLLTLPGASLPCRYTSRVLSDRKEVCRDFLAAPQAEAERHLQDRYPVPKLLAVNQGGSQVGSPVCTSEPCLKDGLVAILFSEVDLWRPWHV